MRALAGFFGSGLREITQGRPLYHVWMALLTLVENAVRHTPTGTQIEVQAGLDSVQERAWVQVCDDGRRDAAPDHVPPVDSLHLGHEIVSRVMQAHGGRFMVAEAPQGFTTCYRMELPLAG